MQFTLKEIRNYTAKKEAVMQKQLINQSINNTYTNIRMRTD